MFYVERCTESRGEGFALAGAVWEDAFMGLDRAIRSESAAGKLRDKRFWRLISHLSLGHLSVVGGETAAEALREVLRLYDFRDSAESRAAIRAC